jgi:hypothetical protein
MTLAKITAGVLLLWPSMGGIAFSVGQSAQTQQAPASSQTTASQQAGQGQTTSASKPCSESSSKSRAECKSASSKPKTKKQPAQKQNKSGDSATSTKVIRNGGTGEPSVAISSDEGQRQARIQETNRLLGAADLNLKDVAVRGASASQEATIKQIRSYMDEAKAAASNGDIERAYNLANKANMLAADLNGH